MVQNPLMDSVSDCHGKHDGDLLLGIQASVLPRAGVTMSIQRMDLISRHVNLSGEVLL